MMKVNPGLTSVPETMLWTLHNRASETMRPNGILHDPKTTEIYKAIDYDYVRSFGPADGFHAVRAIVFDTEIKKWMQTHPEGYVVGLAEGLETQCYRLDNGKIRWLSIDLPEGIEVRERFIKPTPRFQHLGQDAFDFSWVDRVDQSKGVFITAQGLFMYFDEAMVEKLLKEIARRIPNAVIMFDTAPVWMSNLTKKGWRKTKHYTTPLMPWGIDLHVLKKTLKAWLPQMKSLETYDFIFPRGTMRYVVYACLAIPFLRNRLPMMVKVTL